MEATTSTANFIEFVRDIIVPDNSFNVLVLVIAGFAWFLLCAHRAGKNLHTMITTTGRNGREYVAPLKVFTCGTFLLMSWGFVSQVEKGHLTEWYFVGYGGMFVGGHLINNWVKVKGGRK